MTAIDVKNITKSFGTKEILKGISFQVNQGDIFGFLGANGAGKTTTIRILLGLLKPSSGSVLVGASQKIPKTQPGFILDADGLYNELTAVQNLVFYQKIYHVGKDTSRIDQLLKKVGLHHVKDEKAGTFSKGMRQRLSLARALVHDPDILIMDEPLSGIDPPGRIEFREILQEITQDSGKTIFFSSHNLDEVQRICNKVLLLDEGKVKLVGKTEELISGNSSTLSAEIESGTPLPASEKLKEAETFTLQAIEEGRIIIEPEKKIPLSAVTAELESLGAAVTGISRRRSSLEQIYRQILAEREGADL